jgi:hypothetical protein
MGVGSGAFLHPWPKSEPDPHRPGLGAGLVFYLRVHPKPKKPWKKLIKSEINLKTPEKNSKSKRNLKKSRKKPKKPKRKPIYKIWRASKPDPKSDRFNFGCQISPMGSGSSVKFNPATFFHGSDFWSTQSEPDLLPSLPKSEKLRNSWKGASSFSLLGPFSFVSSKS